MNNTAPRTSKSATEPSCSCLAISMYALLYYLLLQDVETARHRTKYVLGGAIPTDIAQRLGADHLWSPVKKHKQNDVARWVYKIWLKITGSCRFRYLNHTRIYAQDMGALSVVLGRHHYSMLPDAPNFMTLNMQCNSAEYMRQQRIAHSARGRLQALIFGNIFVHNLGDNDQCDTIFLSEENTSPVLEGKQVCIHTLEAMWHDAPDEKRDFVLQVFQVTDDDLRLINSKPVIFFSQALVADNILTESEYATLLSGILSHYDIKEVLIKTHPRDHFDYTRFNPALTVFDKKINIQLLAFFCNKVKRVATICSTSVESFPESVQADWFGPGVHPAIERFYGTNYQIHRPHNLMQL